ncbi:MAG: hypothetical protein WAU39_00085 [Polyangiales bacterium]
MEVRRPGIATADRPRGGSLTSLLHRVEEDREALDALIFAYLRLAKPERWALAHAALQDAANPSGALAALLLAEDDHGLRKRLAQLLGDQAPIHASAWSRGTPAEGEACLRQSFAGRSETLCIRWSGGEISHLEIKASEDSSLETAQAAEDTACLIDTLTPLLWRYIRRGGELPEGADRFARFFSVT